MQVPVWIEWLDRRIGTWGVAHLIRILVALNVATFVLDLFSPGFAQSLLLDPAQVLINGEWWRVVTFLFAAGSSTSPFGILFFVFGLLFLWNIGEGLESGWGALALNLYILIPWALLLGLALGPWAQPVSNSTMAASLLLAFATLYPDYEISIFPIPVPIKIKWLGIVVAALAVLNFINDPLVRLESVAGFSSYFLFFSVSWFDEIKLRLESRARMRRFQDKGEDRDR
jgi:hypothetical protein